jgi:hypothetical protein
MLILFLFSVSSCYFLRLSPGVMSQGLGGASVTIDEGFAAFHNPAYAHDTKFNFTLSRWFYSTNLFSIGASYKDYSIGMSYLNYGSIQGFNENGSATSVFTPYDVCIALGKKIGLCGIQIKAFGEKIDGYSLYGVCVGLSTYMDFGTIAIGGKVDNLGKEFAENTAIPFIVAFGSKFRLPRDIEFIVEVKAPDIEINSGFTYQYQMITILFGVTYIRNKISNTQFSDIHFSGGLLVHVKNYNIGYSFVHTEFSMAHQVSLTFTP